MSDTSVSAFGYVSRYYPLCEEELRRLCTDVFGQDASVFAWSRDSVQLYYPMTTRPVDDVSFQGDEGDEGHVFTSSAEVRWKRRWNGYDALVLTETEQQQHKTTPAWECVLSVRRQPAPTDTDPDTSPVGIYLSSGNNRLGYVEYVSQETGVVQFVRYTSLMIAKEGE